MKFVISSSSLSSSLQTIGRVIGSKNTLPVLDCFLFDIKGTQLNVTASDNETTVTTSLELNESDGDLRFAVNAKTIQEAIREIPEQPLDITVDETSLELTIIYQNGRYNFMGQSAEDYPLAPEVDNEVCALTLPTSNLLSGLGRALFAAANGGIRPVMEGIFFDIHPDSVSIVATDGHTMALSTLKNIKATTASFILPKKPAILAKNVFAKEADDIVIRVNARNAIFISPNYTITCRLVEGRYPNYASVIPQDNPSIITVDRVAFLSALRRVLIFSNANSALIKLQITSGKIEISSQDIDFSMSARETLICDYDGMPISIGFKGTFLVELLNNLDSEEVIIKLADSSRAGLILPAENKENEEVIMLIMPMMLND